MEYMSYRRMFDTASFLELILVTSYYMAARSCLIFGGSAVKYM